MSETPLRQPPAAKGAPANGAPANGGLIDNAYTGWGGTAQIDWPERGLGLTAHMPDFEKDGGTAKHYCLVYRPPQGPAFCFEPITHPIDAFHQPGQPGLRTLGQSAQRGRPQRRGTRGRHGDEVSRWACGRGWPPGCSTHPAR